MPGMSSPISRRAVLGGALAGGLGLAGLGSARAQSARADDAARITWTSRQSDRDLIVGIRSPLMRDEVRARVLLPVGYDASPRKHYPVLYLLHGSNGDENIWIGDGAVRNMTAGRDLIVVMPQGGQGGWYSDHLHVDGGPVRWETFHTTHLIDLVDANLRTIPDSEGRAIAGASMGGYGAAIYAGRHHDLFCSVSSFSGATDSYSMNWRRAMYNGPARDGENAGAIYGALPGAEDLDHLRTRNPSTYAGNLAGHRVRLYVGDGASDARLRESTMTFHSALVAAQARDLKLDIIAGGEHDGACFDEALRRDLPSLVERLHTPYVA